MKPLLSLGTIALAIAAATMPSKAASCVTQFFGNLFDACPPTAPPVEQPKPRQAPVHVTKRERHSDQDEKAPPAKAPPALPPRIDSETALHAPSGGLSYTGESGNRVHESARGGAGPFEIQE